MGSQNTEIEQHEIAIAIHTMARADSERQKCYSKVAGQLYWIKTEMAKRVKDLDRLRIVIRESQRRLRGLGVATFALRLAWRDLANLEAEQSDSSSARSIAYARAQSEDWEGVSERSD